MKAAWFVELARDGARNLIRHKLRSTLTLLGVVFGVGAVITMLAIGEGAQRTVLKEIQGLGLNNVILDSTQPPEAGRDESAASPRRRGIALLQYGITFRDVSRLQALLPQASIKMGHLVKQKVFRGSQRVDARVLGVPPDYFSLFNSEAVEGRLLSDLDNLNGRPVAVVTETVAASLIGVGGAVGKTIRIGPDYFEIVGIIRLPSRLAASGVFIPYTTARRLYGAITLKRESGSVEYTRTEVGQVVISLPDERVILDASRVVERMFRETHAVTDVVMTVPLDLLQSKQRTQRILNMVLIAIAAISLLVGGIGIMNIMLAVVTERIPEIGVRRAIGASQQDIMWQFLAETVVLSSAGGVVGCLLGFCAVPLASRFTGWPGVFTPTAVIVALAVSWLVGVIFGLAPAVNAARLKPVECLRYS
jgi:putative ABC transport system permease protein